MSVQLQSRYTPLMPDIEALELNHGAPSSNDPGVSHAQGRIKQVALVVVLFAVGGSAGYWLYQRSRPVAAPAVDEAPAPVPVVEPAPAPARLQGENIPLPPLGESDGIVRALVGKLSSQPKVLAWLATDGLIENFVVVTLAIAEGRSPAKHLRPLAPQGKFRVKTAGGRTLLDRASYQRYDDYAASVGALDATGTARLYLTLKPRIVDAYRQLGHPEGDFDPVFARAIGVLLAVPAIEDDVPLRAKVVTYAFVDPTAEGLSPAARQFLRMGPSNVRTVQAKLREIAALLGLTPIGPTGT